MCRHACVLLCISVRVNVCRLCFLVTYLHNIRIGPALVGLIVLSVFKEDLVHVCAGILKQLVGAVKDDQGNLTVTQHAQLICLLHQAKLSLCKCHLGERRDEEQK